MDDAAPGEAFDCLACGACCHGDDGWVHVGADDDARLESVPAARALVVETRAGGYVRRSLRMAGGACAGLSRDGERVAFCTIYAARPDVCRELEAGSPACVAARERRGVAG